MKQLVYLLILTFTVLDLAQAQKSNTRGFMLGFQLQGTSQALQNQDDSDDGGGGALTLGYGFNDRITAYLSLAATGINPERSEEYALVHVDLGMLIHFQSPRSPWVPYVNVALTGRASGFDLPEDELIVSGGGLSLGGGIRYYVSPVFGFDLGALLTLGEYTEARFGGVTVDLDPLNLDTDATSFRLGLGFAWFPKRRR